MERVMRIELTLPAWKAGALPLSYTRSKKWSGREDLNLRPPAPKAGALAKLRHAPTFDAALKTDNINITTRPRTVSTGIQRFFIGLEYLFHLLHGPPPMTDFIFQFRT